MLKHSKSLYLFGRMVVLTRMWARNGYSVKTAQDQSQFGSETAAFRPLHIARQLTGTASVQDCSSTLTSGGVLRREMWGTSDSTGGGTDRTNGGGLFFELLSKSLLLSNFFVSSQNRQGAITALLC